MLLRHFRFQGQDYDVPEDETAAVPAVLPNATETRRYRDSDGQDYDVPGDEDEAFHAVMQATGKKTTPMAHVRDTDNDGKQTDHYVRDYGALLANPDFAEKSAYKTTANGKPCKFNAWTNRITQTGFDDVLYDAINGNPEALKTSSAVDIVNNAYSTHEGWLNLPDPVKGVFNYLYATEGSEEAYNFLKAYKSQGHTGIESLVAGFTKGATFNVPKLITGDRTLDEIEAAHPGAAQVGEGAGSLIGLIGLSKVFASVPWLSKLPALARAMTTSAAAFGTQSAISGAGDVRAGDTSLGQYAGDVATSAAAGAVGGAAAALTGAATGAFLNAHGLAENALARSVANGLTGAAFGAGDSATKQLSSWLRYPDDYKPDGNQILMDSLVGFAFGMLSGIGGEDSSQSAAKSKSKAWSKWFSEDMSYADLEKAYRNYAKKYHPDIAAKNGIPAAEAAAAMAEINAAHDALKAFMFENGLKTAANAYRDASTSSGEKADLARAKFSEDLKAIRSLLPEETALNPGTQNALQILGAAESDFASRLPTSAAGVRAWAAAHPTEAQSLLSVQGTPSRSVWEKAGLPRVSADERLNFRNQLETPAETPPPVAPESTQSAPNASGDTLPASAAETLQNAPTRVPDGKGKMVDTSDIRESRVPRAQNGDAAPSPPLYSVSPSGSKSPIRRSSKHGVGKEMGTKTYVHRDYADRVVPSDVLANARAIAEKNGFDYNCVVYDSSTGSVRFDEAPDFDTAREPHPGKWLKVSRDGSVTRGEESQIWHHKWLWVGDDYEGFDVGESRDWSRTWLEANEGKGAPSGHKPQWESKLDSLGLPHDVGQIDSSGTSLNQLPSGTKKAAALGLFKEGGVNLDIGGGKSFPDGKGRMVHKGTEFLKGLGVENHVADPFSQPEEVNRESLEATKGGKADTATINNVLNTISSDENLDAVVHQAARAIKPDGTAIFSFYEGDKSGVGKKTPRGYQRNLPTKDYLPFIEKHFGEVELKNGVILARKPIRGEAVNAMVNNQGDSVRYARVSHPSQFTNSDGHQVPFTSVFTPARKTISQQNMGSFRYGHDLPSYIEDHPAILNGLNQTFSPFSFSQATGFNPFTTPAGIRSLPVEKLRKLSSSGEGPQTWLPAAWELSTKHNDARDAKYLLGYLNRNGHLKPFVDHLSSLSDGKPLTLVSIGASNRESEAAAPNFFSGAKTDSPFGDALAPAFADYLAKELSSRGIKASHRHYLSNTLNYKGAQANAVSETVATAEAYDASPNDDSKVVLVSSLFTDGESVVDALNALPESVGRRLAGSVALARRFVPANRAVLHHPDYVYHSDGSFEFDPHSHKKGPLSKMLATLGIRATDFLDIPHSDVLISYVGSVTEGEAKGILTRLRNAVARGSSPLDIFPGVLSPDLNSPDITQLSLALRDYYAGKERAAYKKQLSARAHEIVSAARSEGFRLTLAEATELALREEYEHELSEERLSREAFLRDHPVLSRHPKLHTFEINKGSPAGKNHMIAPTTLENMYGGPGASKLRGYIVDHLLSPVNKDGTPGRANPAAALDLVRKLQNGPIPGYEMSTETARNLADYLLAKHFGKGETLTESELAADRTVTRLFNAMSPCVDQLANSLDASKPVRLYYSYHENGSNRLPVALADRLERILSSAGFEVDVRGIEETTNQTHTNASKEERLATRLQFRDPCSEGVSGAWSSRQIQCVFLDDVFTSGHSLVQLMDFVAKQSDGNIPTAALSLCVSRDSNYSQGQIFVDDNDLITTPKDGKISSDKLEEALGYDPRRLTKAEFTEATKNLRPDDLSGLGPFAAHPRGEQDSRRAVGGHSQARPLAEGASGKADSRGGGLPEDNPRATRQAPEARNPAELSQVADRLKNFIPGATITISDAPFQRSDSASAINDETGATVGTWNRKTRTLTLFPGATFDTIAHELGGHALWQLAEQEADAGRGELLDKLKAAADAALQSSRDSVFANYPDLSPENIVEEVFAHEMGRVGDPALDDALHSSEGKAWYKRLWDAIKDVFRTLASRLGFNRADLSELDGLSPRETANWIVKQMVSGKTIGDLHDSSSGTAFSRVPPVSRETIVQNFRDRFPDVKIGSRVVTQDMGTDYDPDTKSIRTRDYDIAEISRMLGVHLYYTTASGNLPPAVATALKASSKTFEDGMGKAVENLLFSKPVDPVVSSWLNGAWGDANPEARANLERMRLDISRFASMTPEERVRAFHDVRRPNAAVSAIHWARQALSPHNWVDKNYFLLQGMRDAKLDVDLRDPNLSPEERALRIKTNPYLLATAFQKTSGLRIANMALDGTTDLLGQRVTGPSLHAALAPVAGKDYKTFLDYAVARVAQTYHNRGLESGIDAQDANAVVSKLETPEFKQALDDVTDWSRKVMHLLVDTGVISRPDFSAIVGANDVYLPFMRRFLEGDLYQRKAYKNGKAVHERVGGMQNIENPIEALLLSAQRQLAKAQQAEIVRACVATMEMAPKGSIASKWMEEIPAPISILGSFDKQIEGVLNGQPISADLQDILADYGLLLSPGATPAELQNFAKTAKIITTAQVYDGRHQVASVMIDGKRRWFQVNDPLLADLLNGYSESQEDPLLLAAARKLTNLVRFGATMMNPKFGLIRNPIRDTCTAFLFSDYHNHVPGLSLIHGLVKDLAGGKYADLYSQMGLTADTLSAQTMNQAHDLAGQSTARNWFERAWRRGLLRTTASLLSITESAPRLLEFEGAYKHWMGLTNDPDAAGLMAACASADLTVNFRRAGKTGERVSQFVLFANAGIQSIDKLGREMGVLSSMPWEKDSNRFKRFGRTLLRAGGLLTLTSLLSYLRYRDDDEWKNLTPYEKYSYFHFREPFGGSMMRLPLPFEPGLLFGSLPIAICEQVSGRNPKAIEECLGIMANQLPFSVGGLHATLSNFTALAPLVDILANCDYKDSPIVPPHTRDSNEPVNWYTTKTSEAAKKTGELLWPVVKDTGLKEVAAPAYIDHVLNSYSGGLFKSLLSAFDDATDPSGIDAGGDHSTIPLFGTLFTPPSSDRRIGDFYDRMDELQRKLRAKSISPEELGEYRAMQAMDGPVGEALKARREAMADKSKNAGERHAEALQHLREARDAVQKFLDTTNPDDYATAGAGAAVWNLTNPSCTDEQRADNLKIVEGMSEKQLVQALQAHARKRGMAIRTHSENMQLTAYGKRYYALKKLMREVSQAQSSQE
jgi:hypothetical protein